MENKTLKSDTERDVLLKLREAVNSQEEFEWVEAELAALSAREANAALKPTPINSVADAAGFLEEQCDLLAVQMEIVPPIWKLARRDGTYEALFSDIELMDLARSERNTRYWQATGRTVDSVTEPAPFEGRLPEVRHEATIHQHRGSGSPFLSHTRNGSHRNRWRLDSPWH